MKLSHWFAVWWDEGCVLVGMKICHAPSAWGHQHRGKRLHPAPLRSTLQGPGAALCAARRAAPGTPQVPRTAFPPTICKAAAVWGCWSSPLWHLESPRCLPGKRQEVMMKLCCPFLGNGARPIALAYASLERTEKTRQRLTFSTQTKLIVFSSNSSITRSWRTGYLLDKRFINMLEVCWQGSPLGG